MAVELVVLAGFFSIGDFVSVLGCWDLQGVASKMKKLHARFDVVPGTIVEEHETSSSAGSERHVDVLSMLISVKYNADVEWAIARSICHPETPDLAQ